MKKAELKNAKVIKTIKTFIECYWIYHKKSKKQFQRSNEAMSQVVVTETK